RQSQNLVMTTQLQQSIKLLQLSALELSDFVATEIEQNPFLTQGEGAPEYADEAPAEPTRETPAKTEDVFEFGESHTTWDEGASNALDASREDFWGDA